MSEEKGLSPTESKLLAACRRSLTAVEDAMSRGDLDEDDMQFHSVAAHQMRDAMQEFLEENQKKGTQSHVPQCSCGLQSVPSG